MPRAVDLSVLLVLGLSTGCPKPVREEPLPVVDPAELLARATAEPAPTASAVTFDLTIDGPDSHVSANGAMVVSPPDRFRVEVRGPIGPPQLVVVSDGTRLRAYVAGKNELLTADTADTVIQTYTGGEVGLEALAAVLLGRVPTLRAPDLVRPDPFPAFRWTGAGSSHLDVSLDPRTGHLHGFSLTDEAGAELLAADVTGKDWPETLVARVPSKLVVASFEFDEWRPASPPDAAFVLEAPEGVTVRPLELTAPPPPPP